MGAAKGEERIAPAAVKKSPSLFFDMLVGAGDEL